MNIKTTHLFPYHLDLFLFLPQFFNYMTMNINQVAVAKVKMSKWLLCGNMLYKFKEVFSFLFHFAFLNLPFLGFWAFIHYIAINRLVSKIVKYVYAV